MHLRHILTKIMNLQLTHTRKMHSIVALLLRCLKANMQRIDLIKVSSVRQHSGCKKQVSRKQCERHSLIYSPSVHARKKPQLPPQHMPYSLHYKPILKWTPGETLETSTVL